MPLAPRGGAAAGGAGDLVESGHYSGPEAGRRLFSAFRQRTLTAFPLGRTRSGCRQDRRSPCPRSLRRRHHTATRAAPRASGPELAQRSKTLAGRRVRAALRRRGEWSPALPRPTRRRGVTSRGDAGSAAGARRCRATRRSPAPGVRAAGGARVRRGDALRWVPVGARPSGAAYRAHRGLSRRPRPPLPSGRPGQKIT